jgi:heme/copper-type cytochrome/quinol oxidase subunit 2
MGLTYGFIIAASAILALVVFLTIYITLRFRAKGNTDEPPQVSGNKTLELFMVAIPLALVVGFFFWSLVTMNAVLPDRGSHPVRGTVAAGLQGPDLTHFASRGTMLSGMMDNTSVNVFTWLTDPQKVKPGAHMPRFIFSPDSIRAITDVVRI